MQINDDWELESEELNCILYERKTRKARGSGIVYEEWELAGYFKDPASALQDMALRKVMRTGLEDLRTVCEMIKDINQTIAGLGLRKNQL